MRSPRMVLLVSLSAIATSMGCSPAQRIVDGVPDITREFRPHLQQVLDNVAAFSKDPGAWPSHVLVYKGTFETRNQWTGAVGTSTKLENSVYGMTRWELASLDDPYDIRRVRLLYQWQVGHIDFDQLVRSWSEIRDRPVLDGSGKPILGPDGRPNFYALPLPIGRDTRRDWITDKVFESSTGLSGRSGALGMPGTTTIWATDTEAATQFSLAILTAMANSRVKARWGDAVMMTP